ncbi:MAG: phage protein GemA/Gp16 family protein [Sodalis sp. (in: enterobacteria)]|uniref:phage protein GemA/Gp16 family protein n=1 Tax=Sodalis sp. (in: enterobacteria) TaxID=1898979 RepID=UPI003F2E924A
MKNLIKVVHAGKNKLDWDEETCRGVLLREAGENSARDCTAAELARVLRYMRSQGFTTLPKQGLKPRAAAGRQGMLSKIGALLVLASTGRPWGYLNGMIARMLGKKARRMA